MATQPLQVRAAMLATLAGQAAKNVVLPAHPTQTIVSSDYQIRNFRFKAIHTP